MVGEIVDLIGNGEQFLSVPNWSELLCFLFSSSDGDMCTFGAIVLVTSDVLQVF